MTSTTKAAKKPAPQRTATNGSCKRARPPETVSHYFRPATPPPRSSVVQLAATVGFASFLRLADVNTLYTLARTSRALEEATRPLLRQLRLTLESIRSVDGVRPRDLVMAHRHGIWSLVDILRVAGDIVYFAPEISCDFYLTILDAMRPLVKSDTVEAFIGITEGMHSKGRLVITPAAPDWERLRGGFR